MQEKIEAMISYVFGKYDMRKGKKNNTRMKKLLKFCMEDMKEHPSLENELHDKSALEFYVVQSMIYMIDKGEEFKNEGCTAN